MYITFYKIFKKFVNIFIVISIKYNKNVITI